MRDRVGAFGGRLEIASNDGDGTTVQGWIPLP
jgi:signal transduction histidine kinase